MAADGYVLNEELKRLVQQTVKQFASSFQPRPKKGRRQRRVSGGGRGGGGGSLQFMVVTSMIDVATGTVGEIIPGSGTAILYELDGTTRTPLADSGETIYNFDPGKAYFTHTGIWVQDIGGVKEVVAANCRPYDE